MRTLLLLRHAKAASGSDDFARPLTDQGLADAAAMGRHLRDQRLLPAHALVSPSARTRATLESLAAAAGARIATTYEDILYNATDGQLRDRLGATDPAIGTLLILGHNPGIMELALRLAQSGDLTDFDAMRSRFPPCSLVVLAFDTDDWRDACHGGGRLDAFVTPDNLRS